jgi:hypothetical protein
VGRDGLELRQAREAERFLRQNLDELSGRSVIPVLAPGTRPRPLPAVLSGLKLRKLTDDGTDAITALVATLVRDISVAAGAVSGTEDIRADAVETLTDLAGVELDALRWQLADVEVAAAERAVADDDDSGLRAAVSELELLGPVRRSSKVGRDAVEMPPNLRDRVIALIARLRAAAARAALVARLDQLAEGDAEAVLGDSALADAARYRLAADDADPETGRLLGELHHRRSVVYRQRGEDWSADRAAAVQSFAMVLQHAPDRVPPALRADVIAAVEDVAPEVRATWANRVTELVEQTRTSADRAVFDDAVWLAQLVADRSPTDSPEHVEHLLSLAKALESRFRRWRDPADGDAAKAAFEQVFASGGGRVTQGYAQTVADRFRTGV